VPQRYWVEFGSSPGASNLGRYSTTSTTFSVPNVPDGRYFVRVRAENGFGFSTPSAEVSLIVPGCGSLSPPVLSGSVTGALAAIAWTPAPAAGFTSVVAAGSVPGASDIAQVAVGAATSLQAVVPPRRYYVRVRRVSPCGTAVESNEIRLDVGVPPPPAAPTALAFAVNGSTVVLAWQPAAGVVSGYIIEGGSAPGLANLAVLPIGPVSAYTAGGVPPGTYFVRVRASNAGGPGPPSNEVAIVVP
jgi:predicted phage tail protein